MDPKFQTSFIPQKATGTSSNFSSNSGGGFKSFNIFNTIATILFVGVLLAYGGLFAYKQYLNKEIQASKDQLVAARNAFEPDKIHELIDVSNRITSSEKLLENHIAVSQVFALLQNLTVSNVRFSNFSYAKKDTNLIITMDGEASGYNTLAAQAFIFSKNDYIQNSTFSDFDLATNGNVTFKFSGMINPRLISYKNAIVQLESSQAEPENQQP